MSSSDHGHPPGAVGDRTSNPSLTDVLGRLTDRRRRVLDGLLDGRSPVDERDLAVRIAAAEADASREPTEAAVERVRVALRGVDLPALADVGLVDVDEAAGTVAASDHPLYGDPTFRRLVGADADLEDVCDCLADDRRRRVLAVLSARDEPVSRRELAREVAARSPATATSDDLRASLHHVHLPKLDACDLVDYDAEAAVVSRTDADVDPDLDGWIDALLD